MVQWWDSAKIEQAVTREYVCRHLPPSESERLNRSLAFGDGLTDGTYWEWIDTKAKRIFLILVDLGVPDQIFNIIDDSWDDNDLPIPKDQIDHLALKTTKDERLNKRFFQRQFHYLMRPIETGEHVIFTEYDILPLEVVDRRPSLGGSSSVDKVVLFNCPGQTFCRRKVPLGSNPGAMLPADFREAFSSIRGIQNQHLVCYYASYTYQGAGYVLYSPVTDSTLKSFLSSTPSTFKNLPKKDRRQRVLNWMLCLVDSLAYIHSRRQSHGNIKPSTILFTNQLHICYSDFTRLSAEALSGVSDKLSFDRESYDYAAPEQWFRPHSGSTGFIVRKTNGPMSGSPESHANFSIPRTDNPNNPNAMLHSPNPHLNPQAADIFSLGCVLLEMAGFMLKKGTKTFATHRAAKNKTAGRGGAVPDASFHKNLGQLESWMSLLAKEAVKKTSDSDDASMLRGIVPILHVIARMLSVSPHDRPSIWEVQQQIYQVLITQCRIREPHCVHRYSGLELGMGNLRMSASPPNTDPMTIPWRQTSSPISSRDSGSYDQRASTYSASNSSSGHSDRSGTTSSGNSERGGMEHTLGTSGGSTSIPGPGLNALRNIKTPQSGSTGRWVTSPPAARAVMSGGLGGRAPVY